MKNHLNAKKGLKLLKLKICFYRQKISEISFFINYINSLLSNYNLSYSKDF